MDTKGVINYGGPGEKFSISYVFRGIFERRIQSASLFLAYSSFSLSFDLFLREALILPPNGHHHQIPHGRKPPLA